MSKRDFEATAKTLSFHINANYNPTSSTAMILADYFTMTYPNFNKEKFLAACK